MVAKALIDISRGRLGDVKQHRWTEHRMLQLVNQGQANICKLTGIYRKEAYISLSNGLNRYRLPTDCMTIRRLEYKDEPIVLLSRYDLDEGATTDKDFVGIKDNLGMGLIEINPALYDLDSDVLVIEGDSTDDTFIVSPDYGVAISINNTTITIDPVYGVISNIQQEEIDPTQPNTVWGELSRAPEHPDLDIAFPNSSYGVTTEVEYGHSTDDNLFGFIVDSDIYKVVGQYGLITTVAPADNTLKVYYEAVPTDLYSITTTLVIPDMWEEAMIRYIVGNALQDDNDASNIQRGELELQKYVAEVTKARELSTKDFSGGMKEKYNTRFRSI